MSWVAHYVIRRCRNLASAGVSVTADLVTDSAGMGTWLVQEIMSLVEQSLTGQAQ